MLLFSSESGSSDAVGFCFERVFRVLEMLVEEERTLVLDRGKTETLLLLLLLPLLRFTTVTVEAVVVAGYHGLEEAMTFTIGLTNNNTKEKRNGNRNRGINIVVGPMNVFLT
mmetsp:Transcript_23663/g.34489  ORF Transcript_23663/g.34489 Transcript_23663/m.34489 type:complete len:112 (-) Transcript_23663:14-349(-)